MISVVTPSHCQPEWLKLCTASIADQEGVAFEHIIQDTGKTEGLESLERDFPDARLIRERDEGMYDAVNRGLRKSRGDICCYLNCDEQYLPGTLKKVQEAFDADPDLDVLFGDAIIVGADGGFLSYRKSVLPRYSVVSVCPLPILTCATFFRRRILDKGQHWFNPAWKDLGDAQWVLGLVKAGVRMKCLNEYTSTFTLTGENMNFAANAMQEARRHMQQAPILFQWFRPVVRMIHRIDKLQKGCYRQDPFQYEIYTSLKPGQRNLIEVPQPTFRYPEVQLAD